MGKTFSECADGFQGLLKAFHYTIELLNFYLLLNYLLFLKMLTETLLPPGPDSERHSISDRTVNTGAH